LGGNGITLLEGAAVKVVEDTGEVADIGLPAMTSADTAGVLEEKPWLSLRTKTKTRLSLSHRGGEKSMKKENCMSQKRNLLRPIKKCRNALPDSHPIKLRRG